jgi:hypothetical protein
MMRLVIAFLSWCLVAFLSSCGCSGYGGEFNRQYENRCFISLEDSNDSILIVKYNVKDDSLYFYNKVVELTVSKIIPTDFFVKTAKKEYHITMEIKTDYSYWEDRDCGQSGGEFIYSEPFLHQSSGGDVRISGKSTRYYNYSGYRNDYIDRYDTLYLK